MNERTQWVVEADIKGFFNFLADSAIKSSSMASFARGSHGLNVFSQQVRQMVVGI
jgi:hypothetical protein